MISYFGFNFDRKSTYRLPIRPKRPDSSYAFQILHLLSHHYSGFTLCIAKSVEYQNAQVLHRGNILPVLEFDLSTEMIFRRKTRPRLMILKSRVCRCVLKMFCTTYFSIQLCSICIVCSKIITLAQNMGLFPLSREQSI